MTSSIIPKHWTAREALTVYEFISTIQDEIWSRYGVQLMEILREECSTNPADWNCSVNHEDLDDDVPF